MRFFKGLCFLAAVLLAAPVWARGVANASCSLSVPILAAETLNVVDDYYPSLQWQQAPGGPATFIGPNHFIDPSDNPTVNVNTYLQEYSKSFVTGVDTPIDDNAPSKTGVEAYKMWQFTETLLTTGTYAGCYEANYTNGSLVDESFNPRTFAVVAYAPAWCTNDSTSSNTCVTQGRVNSTHPHELLSYEVIDSLGKDSGEIASSANCIHQGPPNNTGDRGAICINTTTP